MDKISEEGRKTSDNVWYFDLGNSYLSVTFCKGKCKVLCHVHSHTHTKAKRVILFHIAVP